MVPSLLEASSVVANSATTSPQSSPPGDAYLSVELSSQNELPLRFSFDALALTPALGLGQPLRALQLVNVMGGLMTVDTLSNSLVNNQTVACVSCDLVTAADSNRSTPSAILNHLMDLQDKPRAILLYSLMDNYCGLGGIYTYSSVLTMANASSAAMLLRFGSQSNNDTLPNIVISGNITSDLVIPTSIGSGSHIDIGMSLLYTFTALVTLLFLAVIITGAIRAHRYPERYGPRSGRFGGRRQSRAKGLARAVLDTLPIVKFHHSSEELKLDKVGHRAATDEDDRDLAANNGVHIPGTEPSVGTDANFSARPAGVAMAEEQPTAHASEFSLDRSAMHAAVAASNPDEVVLAKSTVNESDNSLGCSICTDDFQNGQDVRVLPCNHKFHPACVDPWLINVSGTCPLCRLDLRGSSQNDDGEGYPPPIEMEGAVESPGWSPGLTGSRRLSRLLDWGRLRTATDEERIATLRHIGTEQRRLDGDGDAGRRARVTAWLRDKMQVRLRVGQPEGEG